MTYQELKQIEGRELDALYAEAVRGYAPGPRFDGWGSFFPKWTAEHIREDELKADPIDYVAVLHGQLYPLDEHWEATAFNFRRRGRLSAGEAFALVTASQADRMRALILLSQHEQRKGEKE